MQAENKKLKDAIKVTYDDHQNEMRKLLQQIEEQETRIEVRTRCSIKTFIVKQYLVTLFDFTHCDRG